VLELPSSTKEEVKAMNSTAPILQNAKVLTIRRVDPETAKTLLSELDEFDGDEQRETLNYLKQALNETRAAEGARLIFPE
jgi:hypothetical protein